jgi:hypothetical protein
MPDMFVRYLSPISSTKTGPSDCDRHRQNASVRLVEGNKVVDIADAIYRTSGDVEANYWFVFSHEKPEPIVRDSKGHVGIVLEPSPCLRETAEILLLGTPSVTRSIHITITALPTNTTVGGGRQEGGDHPIRKDLTITDRRPAVMREADCLFYPVKKHLWVFDARHLLPDTGPLDGLFQHFRVSAVNMETSNSVQVHEADRRAVVQLPFDHSQTVVLPATRMGLQNGKLLRMSAYEFSDYAPRGNLTQLPTRFHDLNLSSHPATRRDRTMGMRVSARMQAHRFGERWVDVATRAVGSPRTWETTRGSSELHLTIFSVPASVNEPAQ